jgi:hypothetical protein
VLKKLLTFVPRFKSYQRKREPPRDEEPLAVSNYRGKRSESILLSLHSPPVLQVTGEEEYSRSQLN